MTRSQLESSLESVIATYRDSFVEKVYSDENDDHDPIMDLFAITPATKRENRQYWGRELGMCWQRIVVELCRQTRADFQGALRIGADEPCDLIVGDWAIDTKYRIGSGDSGTLKKFKAYGPLLRQRGLQPALLIVRTDNLGAAITACRAGKWHLTTGDETFAFISELTGFDLKAFLAERAGEFPVVR